MRCAPGYALTARKSHRPGFRSPNRLEKEGRSLCRLPDQDRNRCQPPLFATLPVVASGHFGYLGSERRQPCITGPLRRNGRLRPPHRSLGPYCMIGRPTKTAQTRRTHYEETVYFFVGRACGNHIGRVSSRFRRSASGGDRAHLSPVQPPRLQRQTARLRRRQGRRPAPGRGYCP